MAQRTGGIMITYHGKKYKTMTLTAELYFQGNRRTITITGMIAPESLLHAMTTEDGDIKEDAETERVDEAIYHFVDDKALRTLKPFMIARHHLDEKGKLIEVLENDYKR